MILGFWWAIAFLLAMLWQLIKAIWWVVLLIFIGGWVLSHTDEWLPIIKKHRKKIIIAIVGIVVVLLCIWGFNSIQRGNKTESKDTLIVDMDSVIIEPIDTIQLIVDSRKDSVFEGNIFAGLRFGINKSEYDRLMRKFKRDYNNEIVFPTDKGSVISYRVSWANPKFYHGKLYEVEVHIDNYHAYYELEPIFEQKYGKTKYKRWEWQNAEIKLSSISHRAYDPSGDKGYGSSFSGWYYSGSGSKYLTREPGYTTIRYQDLTLYNLERKEQLRNDSIQQAKERVAAERRRQREREKASKYKDNI